MINRITLVYPEVLGGMSKDSLRAGWTPVSSLRRVTGKSDATDGTVGVLGVNLVSMEAVMDVAAWKKERRLAERRR